MRIALTFEKSSESVVQSDFVSLTRPYHGGCLFAEILFSLVIGLTFGFVMPFFREQSNNLKASLESSGCTADVQCTSRILVF